MPHTTIAVPRPPSQAQKYLYHRKGNRYLLLAQFASVTCTTYSLVRFSMQTWWTALYLLPVLGSVLYIIVNLAVAVRGRAEFDIDAHEERVGSYQPRRFASVDVFLPSAGEPLELLENTYRHVAALQWPGRVVVHVLDDSHRPGVAELAEQYGFSYLARPNRGEMKKAGNLKYGYEHSNGDIIAVFDADFVPRPEYLFELVPYFDDATVGIVQSPQFFDTDRSQNWLQRSAGSVQELFYRNIQPTRSNIGAPICVGTCALYRRAALVEAGGFAWIEHSEDVHTGFKLMRAGFRTTYVPLNMAKGVCPDDMRSFFNQQYRWCAGSMSLMRSKFFWDQPLTLFQRLCFISGFSYYIFTALWVFLGVVPIVTMAAAFPAEVHLRNYLPLLPGVLYMWFFLPAWHKMTHRSEVVRVKTVYAYAHLCALMDTARGKLQPWQPTGASVDTGSRFRLFRRLNVVWGGGTSVALLGLASWRIIVEGYPWFHWVPMIAFACFGLYSVHRINTAPGMRRRKAAAQA